MSGQTPIQIYNQHVDVIDLTDDADVVVAKMAQTPKLKAIQNLAYEVKGSKHELEDLFEAIRKDRGRFVIDSSITFDNIRLILASSFQLEMMRKVIELGDTSLLSQLKKAIKMSWECQVGFILMFLTKYFFLRCIGFEHATDRSPQQIELYR